MIRSKVGRILFGLLTLLLLLSQIFPFDTEPVEALGPYEVTTGSGTFSTAWEHQRKLAIESDGTMHAVYFRTDGSGFCQIYHAYSSDEGMTWTEEPPLTSSSRDQVYPALAIDSQDNLHFVWQDGDEGKMTVPGGNPIIRYRCKDKQSGWQASENVSSYAAYPAIAIDSNDYVHVVYGNFASPGGWGSKGIRWKEKTINGWQTEEPVSSNTTVLVRRPAIAIDGNDNIHIAWDNSSRTYYDIKYSKRTAAGWDAEVQVNTESNDETAAHHSIAVDGNNHAHIVWARKTSGLYSIRYSYSINATSWQTPFDIEDPTAYYQDFPVIAIDSLGHIHVVWAGQHSGSPTINQIRHREYINSWGPIQNLTSATSNNQAYPSLLWAHYPTINGVKTNQPETGYAFIWRDGTTIRYYNAILHTPEITTEAATSIGADSTTLHMSYTTGDYSTIDVCFAYKKSSDTTWVETSWVSKSASGTYSELLTGLDSNTQYEFKAQLRYDSTMIEGNTLQFTTKNDIVDNIVKVTGTGKSGLKIHKDSPRGETIKVVPDGWTLRIIGGPQDNINGHDWWKIREEDYESTAAEGWVAEDYITQVSTGDLVPSAIPSYFSSNQARVEKAIAWAETEDKKEGTKWKRLCLGFISTAYGLGVSINPKTTNWNWPNEAISDLGDKFYLAENNFNPPRGALVFFSATGEDEPYGHIGIYLGNGQVIHAYGNIRSQNLAGDGGIEQLPTISSYIGWAYPPEEWLNSVETATGTGTATFTTSKGTIGNLTATTSTPCGANPGFSFPHGFFSFTITDIPDGSTVTITITLPSNMPTDTQYPKCINGQWIDATSILGDNDGDNVLTLTIQDGGSFDGDGQANGTIVDPGGPAIPLVQTPISTSISPCMLKPAQMEIKYLHITPEQTFANQPVTISTNVVNTGDQSGNLNVALKINGQVEQTKLVSIGPHATQPITFTVTRTQPGNYTIDIGGQKDNFNITSPGGTTSTASNDRIIAIFIIGGLILATLFVISLLIRRTT